MAQDFLHHVSGHLLNQIHGVVQEHLPHDFVQLFVGKALDEQLLGVAIHIGEGVRRQLFGQQAEDKGHGLLGQLLQQHRRVGRVHVLDQGGDFGIFLLL